MFGFTIDNKFISLASTSVLEVQVSKNRNRKSSYKTVTRVTGEKYNTAVIQYAGISIHSGYRKRLLVNGKVVHRRASI